MLFTVTPILSTGCASSKSCSFVMPEPWYIASEKATPLHITREPVAPGVVLGDSHPSPSGVMAGAADTSVGCTADSVPATAILGQAKPSKPKVPNSRVGGSGVGTKRKRSSFVAAPAVPAVGPAALAAQHAVTELDRTQLCASAGSAAAGLPGKSGSAVGLVPSTDEADSSRTPPAPKRPRTDELAPESGEGAFTAAAPAPALDKQKEFVARVVTGSLPPPSAGGDLGAAFGSGEPSDDEGEELDDEQPEREDGEARAPQLVVEATTSLASPPSLGPAVGNIAGTGDDGGDSPIGEEGPASHSSLCAAAQASSRGSETGISSPRSSISVDLPPVDPWLYGVARFAM